MRAILTKKAEVSCSKICSSNTSGVVGAREELQAISPLVSASG